jgi:beta-galactosidase
MLKMNANCLPLVLMLMLAWLPTRAEQRSLTQDWRFLPGDVQGAEQAAFNDGAWRKVVVPHDWSIMDKADGTAPFDRNAVAGQDSCRNSNNRLICANNR